MKCYECGETLYQETGDLQLPSDQLGNFTVQNVSYYFCTGCDNILLSGEAWEKADKIESRLLKEKISSIPVGEFVSASEAIELLKVTKQAFSKNNRIKNGFIYRIKIGGRYFYNKRSLKQYKETKDGRYSFVRRITQSEKIYSEKQGTPIKRPLSRK